ncbi:MAG: hypothetical protein JSR33_09170 [Proteobacteria bacterium]|nr:hypothetical protein [Pseudomonadota bacterium]
MSQRDYCCEEFKKHFEEGEVAIGYNSELKVYGIKVKKDQNQIEPIDFCPWCGSDLSKFKSSCC